jgi:hypothetical protein
MFPAAYTGIQNIKGKLPHLGGICRLWFIDVNDIDFFPPIDPQTDYLSADITLKASKNWIGPIQVPAAQLGFTETLQSSGGFPFYNIKVSCQQSGEVPTQRVNIENLAYGQYIVVGKQRATGAYIVIGNMVSPLNFDTEHSTGPGVNEDMKTKISFSGECIHKALVLPTFIGSTSGFLYTSPGSPASSANDTEIIYVSSEATKQFTWTATRLQRFGAYPIVECWLLDPSGTYYLSNAQPYVDLPAPNFTTMFYDFGGPVTGYIVIK